MSPLRTTRLVPQVSLLEGRFLQSAVLPKVPSVAAQRQIPLDLTGGLTGLYRFDGTGIALSNGAGRVYGMGTVTVEGRLEISQTGFVGGRITLTNLRGSVTIRIQPLQLSGGDDDALRVSYSIVGGTGAYQNAFGGGTAVLMGQPSSDSRGSFVGYLSGNPNFKP